jgi:hypothetical protein
VMTQTPGSGPGPGTEKDLRNPACRQPSRIGKPKSSQVTVTSPGGAFTRISPSLISPSPSSSPISL